MKKRVTSSEEKFFSSEETFWQAFLVRTPAKDSQIGTKMSVLLASHTKETVGFIYSARHRAEQPGLSET